MGVASPFLMASNLKKRKNQVESSHNFNAFALCYRNFQNVKLRLDFVETRWAMGDNGRQWEHFLKAEKKSKKKKKISFALSGI